MGYMQKSVGTTAFKLQQTRQNKANTRTHRESHMLFTVFAVALSNMQWSFTTNCWLFWQWLRCATCTRMWWRCTMCSVKSTPSTSSVFTACPLIHRLVMVLAHCIVPVHYVANFPLFLFILLLTPLFLYTSCCWLPCFCTVHPIAYCLVPVQYVANFPLFLYILLLIALFLYIPLLIALFLYLLWLTSLFLYRTSYCSLPCSFTSHSHFLASVQYILLLTALFTYFLWLTSLFLYSTSYCSLPCSCIFYRSPLSFCPVHPISHCLVPIPSILLLTTLCLYILLLNA